MFTHGADLQGVSENGEEAGEGREHSELLLPHVL